MSDIKPIPLVDLQAQYQRYRIQFETAVLERVRAAQFIQGQACRDFERDFASFCGGGFVASCGNGTDALTLTIQALLGRGTGTEEIITVSHTFIATAEAIIAAGYRPVLVDIEPETCLMDLSRMEEAITSQTRAVLPVHLYGQMVPMDRLMEITRRHGLAVIEDAAQAHGASFRGKGPGQWGQAACFSFYPGKNLGAWGDGGAVFSRDRALIEKVSMLANHGRSQKYEHRFVGSNSRLDALQASLLSVKLGYLTEWNRARRVIAGLYDQAILDLPRAGRIIVGQDVEHVYHLYVIRVLHRDRVLQGLRDRGIGAGIHYPIPLHEQPALRHLGYRHPDLPYTEEAARQVLSLPIYPELEPTEVTRVVEALTECLAAG